MSKDKEDKGVLNSVESTAKNVISRGGKVLFAGLDALARVEEEGRGLLGREKSSLLKELVSEGRKFVASENGSAQFDRVQGAVRDSFDRAREQLGETYDKVKDQAESGVNAVAESSIIEQMFERKVEKSLENLGYPSRAQFETLRRRVKELEQKLAGMAAS